MCSYYLSPKIYSDGKILLFPLSYFVRALNMILIGLPKVKMHICRTQDFFFSSLSNMHLFFFELLLLLLQYLTMFIGEKHKEIPKCFTFLAQQRISIIFPLLGWRLLTYEILKLTSSHIRCTCKFSDTYDELIHACIHRYIPQKSCTP